MGNKASNMMIQADSARKQQRQEDETERKKVQVDQSGVKIKNFLNNSYPKSQ